MSDERGPFKVGDRAWWGDGDRVVTLVYWWAEGGYWVFRADDYVFPKDCAPEGYDGCGSTVASLLKPMPPIEDPIRLAEWLLS